MDCDRLNEVHAYHDGELPTAHREALEAHLKQCAQCSELLTELRGLSRTIADASLVEMPADVMQRLRDARYVLPDAGVMRIAGWLTAAAAAVLFAGLLLFPKESHEVAVASAADVLDTVAVTPPTETADVNRQDLFVLAQWMADDLSVNERR